MYSKKIILEIYCIYGIGVMLYYSWFEMKVKKILYC